jgi:hypothetical protein
MTDHTTIAQAALMNTCEATMRDRLSALFLVGRVLPTMRRNLPAPNANRDNAATKKAQHCGSET